MFIPTRSKEEFFFAEFEGKCFRCCLNDEAWLNLKQLKVQLVLQEDVKHTINQKNIFDAHTLGLSFHFTFQDQLFENFKSSNLFGINYLKCIDQGPQVHTF